VRILQISSAKTFGGGERHLIDLCRGLATRGHEIFVALRPTNEWQERFDFLPKGNFLHVSLRNSFGVLSAQKIAEYVGENKIEIVHAHLGRDYIPAGFGLPDCEKREIYTDAARSFSDEAVSKVRAR